MTENPSMLMSLPSQALSPERQGPTTYDPTLYDPMDPLNTIDRLQDPDDGIDYDRLIAESEADRIAGHYLSFAEFDQRMQARLATMTQRSAVRDWPRH
jgi:hypothetical protein